MKIGVIIQARMGSTRLPGKIMKKLQGKTVLEHVIERVKQSKLIDEIIIATTTHGRDDVIETEALWCGVKVFRGSEDDVLSRYYYAAKENHLDVVVRITSDCPLIDPQILDEGIQYCVNNNYDIVSNAGSDLSKRTYPRGLDTEIFSFEVLEKSFAYAKETYQREHVTPYIYENFNNAYYYKNDIDYSKHRWTLDTDEDFLLISEIYKHLYHGEHDFYLSDIVSLFDVKPELFSINAHIEQKKLNN
ncbi:cytidylyltransferase domain-containing protein [Isachenkonia alkalipeptolytica]|uniref:Acylneuraminate cytidylyltransferase n=1 Tax=Isachenkonia alkalipeptolytica TaxID=2565777 RepID=A0AA43XNR5_9CLOT|nr:glycosyltransferase family protein [Isachenkonia alkalipeptolytica]NBG89529.1 acylneuraminate cytidylyltransferase [Isachenkonia alkalipeptolytica]